MPPRARAKRGRGRGARSKPRGRGTPIRASSRNKPASAPAFIEIDSIESSEDECIEDPASVLDTSDLTVLDEVDSIDDEEKFDSFQEQVDQSTNIENSLDVSNKLDTSVEETNVGTVTGKLMLESEEGDCKLSNLDSSGETDGAEQKDSSSGDEGENIQSDCAKVADEKTDDTKCSDSNEETTDNAEVTSIPQTANATSVPHVDDIKLLEEVKEDEVPDCVIDGIEESQLDEEIRSTTSEQEESNRELDLVDEEEEEEMEVVEEDEDEEEEVEEIEEIDEEEELILKEEVEEGLEDVSEEEEGNMLDDVKELAVSEQQTTNNETSKDEQETVDDDQETVDDDQETVDDDDQEIEMSTSEKGNENYMKQVVEDVKKSDDDGVTSVENDKIKEIDTNDEITEPDELLKGLEKDSLPKDEEQIEEQEEEELNEEEECSKDNDGVEAEEFIEEEEELVEGDEWVEEEEIVEQSDEDQEDGGVEGLEVQEGEEEEEEETVDGPDITKDNEEPKEKTLDSELTKEVESVVPVTESETKSTEQSKSHQQKMTASSTIKSTPSDVDVKKCGEPTLSSEQRTEELENKSADFKAKPSEDELEPAHNECNESEAAEENLSMDAKLEEVSKALVKEDDDDDNTNEEPEHKVGDEEDMEECGEDEEVVYEEVEVFETDDEDVEYEEVVVEEEEEEMVEEEEEELVEETVEEQEEEETLQTAENEDGPEDSEQDDQMLLLESSEDEADTIEGETKKDEENEKAKEDKTDTTKKDDKTASTPTKSKGSIEIKITTDKDKMSQDARRRMARKMLDSAKKFPETMKKPTAKKSMDPKYLEDSVTKQQNGTVKKHLSALEELMKSGDWKLMDETNEPERMTLPELKEFEKTLPKPNPVLKVRVYEGKHPEILGIQQRRPSIHKEIRNHKDPLLGLECIVEVWRDDGKLLPRYFCSLCKYLLPHREIMSHLDLVVHKMAYLNVHCHECWDLFPKFEPSKWHHDYVEALERVCKLIEEKNARPQTMLVTAKSTYDTSVDRIYFRVGKLRHYELPKTWKSIFLELKLELHRLNAPPATSKTSIRDDKNKTSTKAPRRSRSPERRKRERSRSRNRSPAKKPRTDASTNSRSSRPLQEPSRTADRSNSHPKPKESQSYSSRGKDIRSRSPRRRSRSPRKRSRSPRKRSRSPRKRSRSPPPHKRSRSPQKRALSPRAFPVDKVVVQEKPKIFNESDKVGDKFLRGTFKRTIQQVASQTPDIARKAYDLFQPLSAESVQLKMNETLQKYINPNAEKHKASLVVEADESRVSHYSAVIEKPAVLYTKRNSNTSFKPSDNAFDPSIGQSIPVHARKVLTPQVTPNQPVSSKYAPGKPVPKFTEHLKTQSSRAHSSPGQPISSRRTGTDSVKTQSSSTRTTPGQPISSRYVDSAKSHSSTSRPTSSKPTSSRHAESSRSKSSHSPKSSHSKRESPEYMKTSRSAETKSDNSKRGYPRSLKSDNSRSDRPSASEDRNKDKEEETFINPSIAEMHSELHYLEKAYYRSLKKAYSGKKISELSSPSEISRSLQKSLPQEEEEEEEEEETVEVLTPEEQYRAFMKARLIQSSIRKTKDRIDLHSLAEEKLAEGTPNDRDPKSENSQRPIKLKPSYPSEKSYSTQPPPKTSYPMQKPYSPQASPKTSYLMEKPYSTQPPPKTYSMQPPPKPYSAQPPPKPYSVQPPSKPYSVQPPPKPYSTQPPSKPTFPISVPTSREPSYSYQQPYQAPTTRAPYPPETSYSQPPAPVMKHVFPTEQTYMNPPKPTLKQIFPSDMSRPVQPVKSSTNPRQSVLVPLTQQPPPSNLRPISVQPPSHHRPLAEQTRSNLRPVAEQSTSKLQAIIEHSKRNLRPISVQKTKQPSYPINENTKKDFIDFMCKIQSAPRMLQEEKPIPKATLSLLATKKAPEIDNYLSFLRTSSPSTMVQAAPPRSIMATKSKKSINFWDSWMERNVMKDHQPSPPAEHFPKTGIGYDVSDFENFKNVLAKAQGLETKPKVAGYDLSDFENFKNVLNKAQRLEAKPAVYKESPKFQYQEPEPQPSPTSSTFKNVFGKQPTTQTTYHSQTTYQTNVQKPPSDEVDPDEWLYGREHRSWPEVSPTTTITTATTTKPYEESPTKAWEPYSNFASRLPAPEPVPEPPKSHLDSVAEKLNFTLTRILKDYKPTGGIFTSTNVEDRRYSEPAYSTSSSGSQTDKVALASNIASTLTKMGMTNLTQEQLVTIMQSLGVLPGGEGSREMNNLRDTVHNFERAFQHF